MKSKLFYEKFLWPGPPVPNNGGRWAETETETEPKETLPQVHFVSSTIISCPPIQPFYHVTHRSHLVVPIVLNPNISIQYFRVQKYFDSNTFVFRNTSIQYFEFNLLQSCSDTHTHPGPLEWRMS